MNQDLDPTMLAQWLAEDLTPDQQEAINAWVAADPGRRAELDEMREVWERTGHIVAAQDVPGDTAAAALERWNAVRRAIGHDDSATRRSGPKRSIDFPLQSRPRRQAWRGWAVAASIVFAVGAAVAWQTLDRGPASPALLENVVAPVGRPSILTLADGSTVVLAPGSRFSFTASNKPGSVRAARLDGQAYFTVAHDARRPFVVTTGMVVTRVLGTVFNVRAYADEATSTVTVRSGRVGVTHARSGKTAGIEVVVTPGYEMRVNSRNEALMGVADTSHALAWISGRLEFVGADVVSVLRDVNRWYGTEIRLADTSLARSRLTITFHGDTKEQVLARLRRLLGPAALVVSSNPGSRQ